MKTELVTAPTTEALRLGDIKRQLRLSTDASNEDKPLKIYRAAARERCEGYTGRKFIKQRWYLYLDQWPTGDSITIPYAPLSSMPSSGVCYKKSSGGGWNQFSSTAWEIDITDSNRVVLGYSESWPSDTLWNVNPIRLEFFVGHATKTTSVPEHFQSAMLMTVGHLYENRENVVASIGISVQEVPQAAEYILAPHRFYKF